MVPFFRKHSNVLYSLFFGTIVALFSGCELLGDDPTPGIGDVEVIAYDQHIQSIFDNRCTSCHGANSPDSGLRLDGWTFLIQGSDFGEAIIPFSSIDSRLVKLLDPIGSIQHPADVGKEKLSEDEFGLLKRWIDEGAIGPLGSSPFASSLNLLYVAHDSEPVISIIDTDAWIVIRRVHLEDYGFSERARAHHIAVEPDGSIWYVSVGSPEPTDAEGVVKFNRQNQKLGQFETPNPGLLALHPTQDVLYVSRNLNTSEPRSLVELRRSDMLALEIPTTFAGTHALAIRPFGDFLFSSSVDVDQMVIVDLSSLEVRFFDIGGVKHGFGQFSISPSGDRMWGTGMESNTVTLFDISNPFGVVQRQSLNVGGSPLDLTYLPDASKVYVTIPNANKTVVLNANLDIVERNITHAAIQGPMGVSVSSNGQHIFVSNRNTSGIYPARHVFPGQTNPGTIVVVDSSTDTVVKVIEVGKGAALIGSRVVVPTFSN